MTGFEDHHLLGQMPRQRVKELAARREDNLCGHLESASAELRKLSGDLEHATRERERVAAEAALRRATSESREESVRVTATEVSDGVREFANGLLATQGRLAVHADVLRDYTVRVIREIRERLNSSELFHSEPVLSWQQDPIAQSGIRTCEKILAERRTAENPNVSVAQEGEGRESTLEEVNPCGWPAAVLEWEAQKSASDDRIEQYEHIPEAALRRIVAGQFGVRPEEVTADQTDQVAFELCHHYGRFRVVPEAPYGRPLETDDSSGPRLAEDEAFWKEREDEFRKHDTGQNAEVFGWWFSMEDSWMFRTGPGVNAPSAETLQLFKSLAGLAAKGLSGERGSEPWIDWLNLLRRAKDDQTGELLFAKVAPRSTDISERELERWRCEGKPIPVGGLIEYVEVDTDRSAADEKEMRGGTRGFVSIEKWVHWDSSVVTIERLFRSSANYCLGLRSLSPRRKRDVANTAGQVTPSPLILAEREIRMSRPSEYEIEKFAKDAFDVARDDILEDHAKKEKQILEQARLTHNSGAHLPALIESASEEVRVTVLALADANVRSFTLHGVPIDGRAKKDFEKTAREVTAGTISRIRGQLQLRALRLRISEEGRGMPWQLDIERAMGKAVKKGKLLMDEQRIKFRDAGSPVPPQSSAVHRGGGSEPGGDGSLRADLGPSVNLEIPSEASEKAEIIALMRLIEKWRMAAGDDGGKLTQEQVAGMLKFDRRDYSAAKEGKPRAKDHLGRIRKFAADRGLI